MHHIINYIQHFYFSLKFSTAVTGQPVLITVRDGDEVTLSCRSVTDQDKCDRTDWAFVDSTYTLVELIERGQIGEDAKVKSDRLSVTVDCSLVIKKITGEDVGRYYCRQYDKSGQQQGLQTLVDLSVIISEYLHHNVFRSNCLVRTIY